MSPPPRRRWRMPSTTLTTSLVRPREPSRPRARTWRRRGRTCPRRGRAETGHLDDRTTCGLGGSGTGARPGTHEGRPEGRAEGRRADEHHRSECRVRRARRLAGSPPRRRVVSWTSVERSSDDESPSTWRVGSIVALATSREVASRRLRSATRVARVGGAMDRVRSSVHRRRPALARWVTTTARRGSFPPSRRRGRGPETRQIRPRRRPLRAARFGALLAGWAGGGGRSVPPPTRPSAFSGYGAFATSSRRATDTTPNTTGEMAATDPSDSALLAEPPARAGATSTSAAQTSANLRPCLFWRQRVCAKTATSAATSTATRSSRARSSPPPAGAASATSAPSDTSPSPVRIPPPREPQAPRFYPRRRTHSPHTPRTAGAGCVARPIP